MMFQFGTAKRPGLKYQFVKFIVRSMELHCFLRRLYELPKIFLNLCGNKYLSISLKSILVRLNILMSSWFNILHFLFGKVTPKVILFQIIPSIMSFWQENYAFIKVFL